MTIEHLSTGAAYSFSRAKVPNPGQEALPAVLLVHGWSTNIFLSETFLDLRDRLNEVGVHVFMLSLRGHAETAAGKDAVPATLETCTRQQHLEDVFAAMQWLQSCASVDIENIGALGSSYGGYMLAVTSGLNPPKVLALRAPALYPTGDWCAPTSLYTDNPGVRAWRKKVHERVLDSCALEKLSHYQGVLHIFWGMDDHAIPEAVIKSYTHAARSSPGLTYYPHAGHTFTGLVRKVYVRESIEFFSSHLLPR